MFQEIRQKKNLKNVRIAKLIFWITFFIFLDVLNFIICMSSGTVHTGQCLRRIAGGNVGLPLDTTYDF